MRSKSLVSPLLDMTACLELVVESVCMYQIQLPMTYVWHTQTLSVITHTQDPQTSFYYYSHVPPPPLMSS